MQRFTADFHTHTSDDPHDRIRYSTEELIDAAAANGIQVLAITCHDANTYSPAYAAYAQERDVLLIPGVERMIEGRHVLVLNPDLAHLQARSFADLRRAGKGGAAIIAPHPFYPLGFSLREKLLENIELFDAIEYTSFYWYGCNFNRDAERIARRHGLPMVGNSDTHVLPYCASTFTWIDAELTIEGVIDAIRHGRTGVVTRPRPWRAFVHTLGYAAGGIVSECVGRVRRRMLRQEQEVVQG